MRWRARRLRLHQHSPGALVGLDEYLYRRTSGMIGSLSQLIRGAAILAIEDGNEQITRGLLDLVPVDYAAEKATRAAPLGQRTPAGREDSCHERLMPSRLPIAVAPAYHETAAS